MLFSHSALYDEALGGLRLHPHPYSLQMKPRSPLLGVATQPLLPLQTQQLQLAQLQQLQQQQQMQSAQLQQLQLLQANTFQHQFLHPTTQLANAQQQQLQHHQQQQQQQEALLRQLQMNAADPRLSLLSQPQMGFLQSASVSPALHVQQQMAASTAAGVGGVIVPKPTTPPGTSSSAFHAVGQSGSSPVVLSRSTGNLASSIQLPSPSSVSGSPLNADGSASSLLLASPRHPTQLPSLAFRSLSAQDVPSFNAAFVQPQPQLGPFPAMTADGGSGAALTSPPGAAPLFTCTPTATGYSLYRPYPNAPLK